MHHRPSRCCAYSITRLKSEYMLWIIRNLYLTMVIGQGRILAKDENMFSSIVFDGSLSDASLKDMMSKGKKRTERSVWGRLCSIPEQRICVEVFLDKHYLSCLWAFANVFSCKISLTSSPSFVNSYLSFRLWLNYTFSKGLILT